MDPDRHLGPLQPKARNTVYQEMRYLGQKKKKKKKNPTNLRLMFISLQNEYSDSYISLIMTSSQKVTVPRYSPQPPPGVDQGS